MEVPNFLIERSHQVDEALDRLLPGADQRPQSIHQAMRYSTFAGGKRLRPALCLEAGKVAGAADQELIPVACAIEMIHTYSLIHDDLPALDNDDLRRGQLTVHKKFGEAIAILAGDALLTRAFQILSGFDCIPLYSERRLAAMREIACAVGTVNGMIGGQVADLEAEGETISADLLQYIHSSKTGALIRASVRAGAVMGDVSETEIEALTSYGTRIGLAFQIVDDILDRVSSREVLGKTPGKDRSRKKATFPALFGLDDSRRKARSLVDEALRSLEPFGEKADHLRELARFFVERAA
ncbi:MAG: polyprenyl synthetase family protein [Acidobacteriia bacterium]|nr:polyprenyl synthetase family protein [Terriglobia bacterium]